MYEFTPQSQPRRGVWRQLRIATAYISVHEPGEDSPKDKGQYRRVYLKEYMEQRRIIARFARGHGLQVTCTLCQVIEEARTDFFAGSAIEALLGQVHWGRRWQKPGSHQLTVLVEDLTRFRAPELDLALVLFHFSRHGVHVFEAASGKELTADLTPLNETVQNANPQDVQAAERRLRAAKWRSTKKANGRKCGPKPYGELPGEERVLEEIAKLRQKPRNRPRKSYQEIADILNGEGIPTRSGQPWQAKTVQVIVLRSMPWLHDRKKQTDPYWRNDGRLRRLRGGSSTEVPQFSFDTPDN